MRESERGDAILCAEDALMVPAGIGRAMRSLPTTEAKQAFIPSGGKT